MLPILLPLLLLSPLSSALPTSLNARDAGTTESWHIPRLQTHMMSSSTGLPGPGTWPVSAQFNSSIDFDILVPDSSEEVGKMMQVNCKASWLNGTLPEGMVGCGSGVVVGEAGETVGEEGMGDGEVQFGMQIYEGLGARRPELSFLLSVSRNKGGVDSPSVALQGQVPITANDASEPSSYLTCLLGAPLDGLRCQIGSYMSVRKELVIEGSAASKTSHPAIQTASSALQGLRSPLPLTSNTASSSPYPCPLTRPKNAKRLNRIATKARNSAASTMRKMHVPAYCPESLGVQVVENRGVLVEVKKVMAMVDMSIFMDEEDDMSMLEVEVGMETSVMVAIDMVILFMSMAKRKLLAGGFFLVLLRCFDGMYIADYVFALPTIAFFMSVIGIFIVAHFASAILLRQRNVQRVAIWRKMLATTRYLSYRGFHVRKFGWNSAPVGVLLLGAAGTTFFFCMDLAPKPYYWVDEKFGGSPPLATRSGWLALACMPFVFATASKINWITLLTGVSYERLQVFHRWIAYSFFLLALIHTFPFIVYHIHWHDIESHFSGNLLFYWTGIVALVCQAWLTFMSHSVVRNLGYEFFKATHFIAVVVFILTFFWHCDYTLTSWHYFIATAAVYVPCFVYPWLRTAFEYKWTQQARVSVEDNGFTRISIPAKFHWTPGQHCFLRFTGFGILSALSGHPFTICSSPPRTAAHLAEIVFYIRHQKGLTDKLYQHALDRPDVGIPVMVDGPYGGISSLRLRNADRLLIIAGGSGAGWCLPFIEHFIRSASSSSDEEQGRKDATGKDVYRAQLGKLTSLRIVLATRDTQSCLWFERTIQAMLAQSPIAHSSSAQVQVYLTGEAAEKADLPSKTAAPTARPALSEPSGEIIVDGEKGARTSVPGREYEGRPQLPVVVQEEAEKAADADEMLNVYVCGPKTMQNDVRNAVAAENLRIVSGARTGGIYLHSEHFSWA
ncbi:hypothetical protein DDE82_006406 [Stemphylium lycopersici]|nr:hypothetical protein DDE82_006406 [Stemphylium lycopersici]